MTMVRIRPGDTLGHLVTRYNRQHSTNFTVEQIQRANGIINANRIQASSPGAPRHLIFPDQFEQTAQLSNVTARPLLPLPVAPTSSDATLQDEVARRRNTSIAPLSSTTQLAEVPLSPRTAAAVQAITQGMSPEDRAIVMAKARELVNDNAGVEQTSPEKFAANMVSELTEYLAQPGTASPQMLSAVSALYTQSRALFEANPEAHHTILRRIGLELEQAPT